MKKKVKVEYPKLWTHHRGGWNYCVSHLIKAIHNPHSSLKLYTNGVVDNFILGNNNESNWMGFLHITRSEKEIQRGLEQKKLNCLGLFVLSNYTKEYVKEFQPHLDIETVYYPTTPCNLKFNFDKFLKNKDKKILHIGHWLRNFDAFYKIQTNKIRKVLINCTNLDFKPDFQVINYLDEPIYDQYLSENIVFLNLIDSSANSTILECIERNTPIIVNRLPAIEEYLGKNYPLFYNGLTEVGNLIEKIQLGHEYLCKLDKSKFNMANFLETIQKSKIYHNVRF